VPAVTERPTPSAFDSKGNLEVVGQHITVIEKVGMFLAQSGLCGAKSTSQGFVVALFGYEHHMPMTDVGMKYHVITQRNGATNLTIKGHQLVSNFQARGGIHKVKKSTETECTIYDKAEHMPGKPEIEDTLTIDEAKEAGWVRSGSAWETNPKRQLYIRLSVNNIMRIDPASADGAPVMEENEMDATQEPIKDQTPLRSEDNDLSQRVKVEVKEPEPEKKDEPHGTFDGTGEHAAAPVTTEAPKPEGGRVPDERVDETLPPEQRIGDAPKPNGKGRRSLKA